MASDCASVSIKYKGDGSQVLYSFPFTYMNYDDIVVFLYNEDFERWDNQANRFVFANETTIEFLTAPPTPTQGEDNIWITRKTDLEQMLKDFYPGSAIRAQDLNDNYDQLRLSIMEGRCAIEDVLNNTVQLSDAYTSDQQEAGAWIPADNRKLATSDAITARYDQYIQPNIPTNPTVQQPGKNWQNTGECYTTYWSDQADAWVAYVNTGPRGIPGQDGAAADVSVGITTTGDAGTNAQVVNTGVNNVAVLNFTIPRGDKGDPGTGINVTGYIDYAGPPVDDGVSAGDYVLDVNGVGWFWETDTTPASWVDSGTIRGPIGPQGPPGQDGDNGDAATITVGLTTTGQPGTNASVVNTGTTSASVLNFTIPRGDKGEPGLNGLGTIRSIRGILPIVVDDSVDANSPAISLNISALPSLPATP